MSTRHFRPSLHKTFVETRDGYRVYSVSGFAVRNAAEADEEFTTFATHGEFPDLLGEKDIWVSEELIGREGEFFVADALTRLRAREAGSPEERAYTVGLNAERRLREAKTGIEYRAGRPHKRIPGTLYVRRYVTLPDERFPIDVWLVRGDLVRCYYKTDYAEGGHGSVYPWVPRREIWIDAALRTGELPYIVTHEYTELRLMRDEGFEYNEAHELCSRVEFDLRKADSRKEFPGFSRRRPTRADLPKLTAPEYFEFVKRNYVRGPVRRAAAAIASAVGW